MKNPPKTTTVKCDCGACRCQTSFSFLIRGKSSAVKACAKLRHMGWRRTRISRWADMRAWRGWLCPVCVGRHHWTRERKVALKKTPFFMSMEVPVAGIYRIEVIGPLSSSCAIDGKIYLGTDGLPSATPLVSGSATRPASHRIRHSYKDGDS